MACTYPPSVNIYVLLLLADISFIPLIDVICCGNVCNVVFPIPNCPLTLYPVPHTFPSASNIAICSDPADIWIMFETFFIFVGFKIGVSDWFPCPNSPDLLLPHPYTSPFAVKAYPV